MNQRKDKKGGYSKHLKKGGGKKAVLYDALDEGQLFGQITKVDGEGRFRILCNDGITRRGKACNQIRKTKDKKITLETFVIVSLRDCDTKDDKCDILAFADPPANIIAYFKGTNKEIEINDIEFKGSRHNIDSDDDNLNENEKEFNVDDI